jgi:hypothetical protein
LGFNKVADLGLSNLWRVCLFELSFSIFKKEVLKMVELEFTLGILAIGG